MTGFPGASWIRVPYNRPVVYLFSRKQNLTNYKQIIDADVNSHYFPVCLSEYFPVPDV
jgi:hypothetical protein